MAANITPKDLKWKNLGRKLEKKKKKSKKGQKDYK